MFLINYQPQMVFWDAFGVGRRDLNLQNSTSYSCVSTLAPALNAPQNPHLWQETKVVDSICDPERIF
jgi:hypothetical protein